MIARSTKTDQKKMEKQIYAKLKHQTFLSLKLL